MFKQIFIKISSFESKQYILHILFIEITKYNYVAKIGFAQKYCVNSITFQKYNMTILREMEKHCKSLNRYEGRVTLKVLFNTMVEKDCRIRNKQSCI